jgi:hypothetical protein
MFDLQKPRHISTLPATAVLATRLTRPQYLGYLTTLVRRASRLGGPTTDLLNPKMFLCLTIPKSDWAKMTIQSAGAIIGKAAEHSYRPSPRRTSSARQ